MLTKLLEVLIESGLPTHKQEFCSPSLQPSLRCKTHAFLPARTQQSGQPYHTMTNPALLSVLCHLDNLILSRKPSNNIRLN